MMVSSLMPATNPSSAGTSRSPSRIKTSWFSMNSFGWPASEGVGGICELPPGPWQHCSATVAGGGCCAVAPAAQAAATSRSAASPANERARRSSRIGDAIDRAELLVGHQQRAVGQLQQVSGPAAELRPCWHRGSRS